MHHVLVFLLVASLLFAVPHAAVAQDKAEAERLYKESMSKFSKGDYTGAISGFDKILGMFPDHTQTLRMKAVAESNLGYHEKSMINFYKVLQKEPDNVHAIVGLGVGFGNFAEYAEAKKYFERALQLAPSNTVVRNYNEYADKVIAKYPYKPTEKPPVVEPLKSSQIPSWVKNNARWWAEGQIGDKDFVNGIEYLIREKIIHISGLPQATSSGEAVPQWVKSTASWWAGGQITQSDFVKGIQYLVETGIITVDPANLQRQDPQKVAELEAFEKYVRKVAQTVASEKRYIEYPNPSGDVIKKFLRDYTKWNFDQQIQAGNQHFPDPTYEVIDGTYIIHYKLFVNVQPSGLPLDHVSTLDQSIAYWESRNFTTSDGNPARVKFTYTDAREQATVWVTWVVRNLGEGVLGHANLGKGVAEVALGDYSCDGSFQLYDVDTVEMIMRHELGHTIGLGHSSDPNSIMYPSLSPRYAYCLLG